MFRTVLVPLDRTSFAEAALPVATRFARNGASVHVMLSHQLVPALAGMGEMLPPPTELDAELREQEESYLVRMAEQVSFETGSLVEHIELDGPAGPAICEEAERIGADLVVMATHGRGPLGRLWHGSVADYVLRRLETPVLLVHPDRPMRRLADQQLRGILVALDLSPSSEAILGPVADLARLTRAPVTLMHVVVDPVFARIGHPAFRDAETTAMAIASAGQYLETIAERLRDQGLSVTTRVAAGFNAAWILRDTVAESQFDLLAMTTHGLGGLRRLWVGSVADQLVQETTKPMLVLRSGGTS